MGDMKYFDFDVAIEPAGDGFIARVFNSPVGQAANTFTTPFSTLELENFLLRVGRSRHAVRRIESPEMASAKQFGGRLFDQVFAGEVRGCLRSSLDEASRQGAGLRVRLHLTKVPALADLPWEFLYNANMNRFLSLSVDTPLVRYLELPERIRPLIVQPPLRVLLMISSPSDYPQLDVKRETAKIIEALSELQQRGLVVVDCQEDATLAELQRRLRRNQYHIFHFVGHGGFDSQADDGLLVMEDQENRGRRVSAQFLGTLLHDHRPLRLAVLNACEGARASRGDPFAGTAQSLVQQGIPAVIAMQFEVTDEAAICFTREFYAAIAVGYPVDAALAEARKAIFAEVSEIEWGTPVLYMRSPDGKVFEVEQISEPERQQLQISSLLTAARTAMASFDHATAAEKLGELLALEPEHSEASKLLADVTREQELAEAELARAAAEAERKQRASELRHAAMVAMAAEQWGEAQTRWQAVLELEPEDREVRAQLNEAQRQQELASLYARARRLADRRDWRNALTDFRQLLRLAPNYKDAAARTAAAELELATAAEEQSREQAAAQSERIRSESTPEPSGGRRQAGWMFVGGAIGAVAGLALLVLGAAVMIMLAGDRSKSANPPSDGKAPYQSGPVRPAPAPDPQPAPAPQPPAAKKDAPIQPHRAPVEPKTAQRVTPPAVDPAPAPRPAPEPEPAKHALNDATVVRPTPPEPQPRAFSGYGKVNDPTPAPAPAPTPAPAAVPAELQQILIATIRYADAAEIEAYRTFNTTALTQVYSQEIVARHVQNLQEAARNQVFQLRTMHRQAIDSFVVSPDLTVAKVRLTEYWSIETRSLTTRQCVSRQPMHATPQTITLVRAGLTWRIVGIEFDPQPEPRVTVCR
jgi:tetratricopeptide (TPR) repeat protein